MEQINNELQGRMTHTSRDTLDTTATSETSDGGLRDTLDVVAKNLTVALGTALAETLAALAACIKDASVMNQKISRPTTTVD